MYLCVSLYYLITKIIRKMTLTNNTIKVKKEPKAIGYKDFIKAWETLSKKDMAPVRRELMDQLGWSPATFDYRRRGFTPIRVNEVPVIEAIFSAYGINAWSGQRI
jgi:hypothetical protein